MKKVIIAVLIALGILFLVIMLMPDDDEKKTDDERPRGEAVTETLPENNAPSQSGTDQSVETVSVGTDARSATIMIYMNGSDLESEAGEASTDISEMLSSGIGSNVNVIIQTMGTREWQDHDISSKKSQTWCIKNGALSLIRDDLGQLDCTSADTMSEFIGYCKSEYPAERYMFLFWDHGGGPVYGFGYDEWQDEQESLTLAEMSRAFSDNKDIHFDIIGMDCCIMADLETCYALAPYCRYTLLSEDFESGLGWSYTNWMKRFEENPGISTPLLGKYIVDSIIDENEKNPNGDSACIGLFNESTAKNLFSAWKTYAYRNEDALLNKNYSRQHKARGRSDRGFLWDFLDLWDSDMSNVTLSDYYISDILALVESIDNSSEEAKNLMSALKAATVYCGHTSDKNELTGLAVSLPYGDSDFYEQLKIVYSDLGIDREYIEWLGGFVSASAYDDYYDFGGFEDSWGGWGSYEDEYGCNISNGSCEYGYDYDWDDQGGYGGEGYCDDWVYDCEEDIWYMYDDDMLYLYDEDEDVMCYYDEENDEVYYYDDDRDDWLLME